jgi:RNA polymerase sigma-70 factor, ECF subfamily
MPDVSTHSDAVLVIATAQGDRSALAEIYRRHGGQVHRLAQRLLGDDRAAEDVTQDVFVRFWQNPSRFDPERGQLRSFLLMKAHGRAVDAMRADWARRKRDDLDALDAGRPTYDLEREVIELDLAERVGRALQELPDAERQAITLAYFGGHTYREVATFLGQPEGTVKSRIRSGLKTMRRHLSGFEPDDTPPGGHGPAGLASTNTAFAEPNVERAMFRGTAQ